MAVLDSKSGRGLQVLFVVVVPLVVVPLVVVPLVVVPLVVVPLVPLLLYESASSDACPNSPG